VLPKRPPVEGVNRPTDPSASALRTRRRPSRPSAPRPRRSHYAGSGSRVWRCRSLCRCNAHVQVHSEREAASAPLCATCAEPSAHTATACRARSDALDFDLTAPPPPHLRLSSIPTPNRGTRAHTHDDTARYLARIAQAFIASLGAPAGAVWAAISALEPVASAAGAIPPYLWALQPMATPASRTATRRWRRSFGRSWWRWRV
jgi:hypothetical protein